MSTVYSPQTNAVSNILNRRSETMIVDRFKADSAFDNLIRSKEEFGDTLEHVAVALSESEAYDPKSEEAFDYKDTVLDKFYNVLNYKQVYLASTDEEQYSRALKNAGALAKLSSKVVGSMNKKWNYDFYNKFVELLENDTSALVTYVPDFSGIEGKTVAEREDLTEKFLQKAFEVIQDMAFMSNKYITTDVALTTTEKARMIATAPANEVTLYLNNKYFSWAQVDLSKRFRNLLDLNQKVKIKIINFTNDERVGYISHDSRYSWTPKRIIAKEASPYKALRTDHSLIVIGTFSTVPLFPATVLVPSDLYPLAPSV